MGGDARLNGMIVQDGFATFTGAGTGGLLAILC
jgi:hypothetical protein